MVNERDRLEQEALKLLEKGQIDRALERYQALLKSDPRDRRLRQKVAELLLKLGRPAEAERHLREIAKGLMSAGQERAAIGVLQQVIKIKPDDPELRLLLGDCYLASGFPNDARTCFDQVLEMYRTQPAKAIEVLKKLIRLSPGELPLKVKMAELMEAANWNEAAFAEWRNLAADALRHGRPDDRARFLEAALRLRSDAVEVRVEAADARLAMGEPRLAQVHLEGVVKLQPTHVRAQTLFAQTLEKLERADLAREVWKTVARLNEGGGDATARADALRRAIACGDDNPVLKAQLAESDRLAERQKLRLDSQEWASPVDEAQAEVVLRAGVQARYGFPDRARATLLGARPALRATLSLRIALAELYAAAGQPSEALAELSGLVAPTADAREQLAIRVAVLGGAPAAADEAVIDDGDGHLDEIVDDDEIIDDEPTANTADEPASPFDVDDTFFDNGDGDELVDDGPTNPPEAPAVDAAAVARLEVEAARLARIGDRDGALEAYRQALEADPSRDDLLAKMSDLLSAPDPEPPFGVSTEPADALGDLFGGGGSSFDLGDIFGALPAAPVAPAPPPRTAPAPAPVAAAAPRPVAGGALLDAEAWLLLGKGREALAALGDQPALAARILAARALRAMGELPRASSELQGALAEAAEDDPSYAEALFELALLQAATQKLRGARRTLDELLDLAPDFRPADLAALRRALELVG